ncbi:hypothetical protein ACV3UL_16295 [Clostridium perfringens]
MDKTWIVLKICNYDNDEATISTNIANTNEDALIKFFKTLLKTLKDDKNYLAERYSLSEKASFKELLDAANKNGDILEYNYYSNSYEYIFHSKNIFKNSPNKTDIEVTTIKLYSTDTQSEHFSQLIYTSEEVVPIEAEAIDELFSELLELKNNNFSSKN